MWTDPRVRARTPEEISKLRGMGQECVRKLYLFAGISDDSYYRYPYIGAFEKAAILYGYQPIIEAMGICQDRNDNIRCGRASHPRTKWARFFWGVLRNCVLRSGQRWGAESPQAGTG